MKRQEIKFIFDSFLKVNPCLSRLSMIADHPPRWVHSIYFDTKEGFLYHQSQEGIVPRKKIRLRWYNNENFLCQGVWEEKWSFEHYREKKSQSYFYDAPKSVQDILRLSPDQLLIPTAMVSYRRTYFKNAKGIRSTWDQNIVYQGINRKLEINHQKSLEHLSVFEIKTPHDMSKDESTSVVGHPSSRFSKYCRAIEALRVF